MSDQPSATSVADPTASAASVTADGAAAAAAAASAADPSSATSASEADSATASTAANADEVKAAREWLKANGVENLEGKADDAVLELAKVGKELKPGAPEKYEDFTAPDGAALDPKVITEFAGAAKELGLSQANAQVLIDRIAPVIAKQNGEALNATIAKADAEWSAAARADKEFGGDKFDENIAVAKRAVDQLGTPELKRLLDDSRLGNHPEVVRWMFRVGSMLSPDGKHITGSLPGQGDKPLEARLWPSAQT